MSRVPPVSTFAPPSTAILICFSTNSSAPFVQSGPGSQLERPYLVNCLAPRDPSIRLVAQNRNYSQSIYQLDYVQGRVSLAPFRFTAWLGALAVVWSMRFTSMWRKRVRACPPETDPE